MKGLIINKFRGDQTILTPGIRMLEERAKVPVLGGDALSSGGDRGRRQPGTALKTKGKTGGGQIDIAVIRLPRNLEFYRFYGSGKPEEVSLRYVRTLSQLGHPDMIILPGTKNTMGDLRWMRGKWIGSRDPESGGKRNGSLRHLRRLSDAGRKP